ncbi:MAG TPA: AMP-binding protein, partial [Thermoanaerobaculia bacterium]|nr:AMP-binding protein [Thermoanaerobaculia bacterium]
RDRRVWFFAGAKPESRSFPEVRDEALQLAARLRAAGVGPGMRVGLLGPNSYAWMLHDLALQSLGAITVAFPEKPPSPPAELHARYRLNLLLAAGERCGAELKELTASAPLEDLARSPVAPTLEHHRPAAAGLQQPLSITFSSGTSGKTKTLKVTAAGTRQVIASFCSTFEFEEGDHFLVFLPLSSYQQRVMIYGSVLFGIDFSLVDAPQLFKALLLFRPTLLLAPPVFFENVQESFLRRVREAGPAQRLAFRGLTGLAAAVPLAAWRRRVARICYGKLREVLGGRVRIMWTGMAPIRPRALRFFANAGLTLYEAYGLNECGPIACNTAKAWRPGSVGMPIAPGSVVIADDGEILVRQPHPVASGYEECEPGEERHIYREDGLLATGDLGFFDADGFLYLRGRKKEVIVTREGFKISPEVLEQKINAHPAVLQSAVFGQQLETLAAVVVVESDSAAARSAIDSHIARINDSEPACFAIQKVHFTTAKFSLDNGQLTRNLKLHRNAIFSAYKPCLTPDSGHVPRAKPLAARAGA